MIDYAQLVRLLPPARTGNDEAWLNAHAVPWLLERWKRHYAGAATRPRIVETTVSSQSYLLDLATGRLLASWSITPARPDAQASLHFTCWVYDSPGAAGPAAVEQGTIAAGRPPEIQRHQAAYRVAS